MKNTCNSQAVFNNVSGTAPSNKSGLHINSRWLKAKKLMKARKITGWYKVGGGVG